MPRRLYLLALLLAVAKPAFGEESAPAATGPTVETQALEGETLPNLPFVVEAEPEREMEEGPESEGEEEEFTPRLWVRAEYLMWFIKDAYFPVLLTTGPTNVPRPGAIGSPETGILFGGRIKYHERSGGRFSGGYWLDDENNWSLEAGYFFLGGHSVRTTTSSQGSPVLARPFFNVTSDIQDSSLVAYPGQIGGSVVVQSRTFLESPEGNIRFSPLVTERLRVHALLGFRYLHLDEFALIEEQSGTGKTATIKKNTQYLVRDDFGAHSHFYGAQLGLGAVWRYKWFAVEAQQKVALGTTEQEMDIRGATFIGTSAPMTFDAGLLAVSSNSGRYARNVFGVVPETDVNLRFALGPRLQVFVGYSFIYWNNVVRPATAIDTNVNTALVPTSTNFGMPGGPQLPAFRFIGTEFWAHGVNFGGEFRY